MRTVRRCCWTLARPRLAIGAKSRSVTSIVTPGYAPIEQYSRSRSSGDLDGHLCVGWGVLSNVDGSGAGGCDG